MSELQLYSTVIENELMNINIESVLDINLFALVSHFGGNSHRIIGNIVRYNWLGGHHLGIVSNFIKSLGQLGCSTTLTMIYMRSTFQSCGGRFSANQIAYYEHHQY